MPLERRIFWIAFVALIAIRIPFFLTHHVQEDAYIVFRSAFNLADHGDYSFNLGEHTPGATSVAYPLVIALLRRLVGSWAINAVQLLNTVLVVTGSYLLAATIYGSDRTKYAFWVATATFPSALFISYFGMETALLLFDITLVLFGLWRSRTPFIFSIGIFLLPLIRPDAIAFGTIFVISAFLLEKRKGIIAAGCLGAGIGTMLLGYFVTSGDFIPTTIRAKELSTHPDRSPTAIFLRAFDIFVSQNFLRPMGTKFIDSIAPVFAVFGTLGMGIALYLTKNERCRLILISALVASALLVPAVYAYGGVLYEWYFLVSGWLAYAVATFALISLLAYMARSSKTILVTGAVALLIGFDAMRFAVSLNVGTQEADYRASVGRYLARIAEPNDTLFLEPAGYIPFFAGLRTFDEIGLVSKDVIRYRSTYGQDWWVRFLQQEHPTFLVQHSHIRDLVKEHQLNSKEADWFMSYYKLIAEFHYDPATYFHNALILRILRLGSHSDYLIFRYVGPIDRIEGYRRVERQNSTLK